MIQAFKKSSVFIVPLYCHRVPLNVFLKRIMACKINQASKVKEQDANHRLFIGIAAPSQNL